METEQLTFARSLRVIGQRLRHLEVDSFELDKRGDDYIVQIHDGNLFAKPSMKQYPSNSGKKNGVWRNEMEFPVRFAGSEILCADVEGRLHRQAPGSMPDMHDLSLNMRVLGDYLDRRAARDFAIRWSTASVKVSYDQKEESFSVHQNLYDLAVCMYLKRSHIGPAK